MNKEGQDIKGFESTSVLHGDFSQYLRSNGFLDGSEYNSIVETAKKGHKFVFSFAGKSSVSEQKSKLIQRANALVRGTDINLRGENDPRVLLFVLLSTDENLNKKYQNRGKLDNDKQKLAEAFRIAGDMESRDKLIKTASWKASFPN